MKRIYKDYIKHTSILQENLDIDFSSSEFNYDFNEVQELLYEPGQNNSVFLVGEEGLRKEDMLARVCKDLLDRGVEQDNILYLDMTLPMNDGCTEIVNQFYEERQDEKVYLIVKEIQEISNWFDFVEELRKNKKNLQLICSSTTPALIHTKLYDCKNSQYRVVVLSKKNDSNIKYQSDGFGVYNNELKYNIKNGIIEIKGMTKTGKKMSHHKIPETIEGLPVKIIASGAFHNRPEIRSIEIPDGVELIGDYAFTENVNLEKITLPKELTYIGENAFLGAENLKIIEGGDKVTHIGNSALYKTKWFENQKDFAILGKVLVAYKGDSKIVEIPSSVDVIGPYAFNNCSVQVVKLSNQKISEGSFYNCVDLEKVEGDFSFDSVPAYAFNNCRKLKNLQSKTKIQKIGKFAFAKCESLQSISCDLVEIGDKSFFNCKNLILQNQPNLFKIGKSAFAECNFSSIPELASNVEIDSCAFFDCGLKLLELQNGAKKIGDFAFAENTKLESCDLLGKSEGTDLIGKAIFYNCNNVHSLKIIGSRKVPGYFGIPVSELSIKSLWIHGDISDDFNRGNTSLQELTIQNCKIFGRWSFYGNSQLEKITLKNVSNIGEWAFAYCDGISEIELPESVKKIGMNGFRYCHNLQNIRILSKEMVPFGANAFYSTGETKNIQVPQNIKSEYLNNRCWKEYGQFFN